MRELYKKLGDQAKAIQRMDNFSDEEKNRLVELQSGLADIPIKNIIPKHVEDSIDEARELAEDIAEEESNEIAAKYKGIQVIYVAEKL